MLALRIPNTLAFMNVDMKVDVKYVLKRECDISIIINIYYVGTCKVSFPY